MGPCGVDVRVEPRRMGDIEVGQLERLRAHGAFGGDDARVCRRIR
ncbi:Hypothetical protein AA314_08731 [Archangium gephyra]|uniref:Uncharacterized protein n=1 Tax=Archangium gephyra TaxID=48 RepID=A0AAC8QGM5_9BACT|nr:Hypothetical protein AA314_08731 [Archangium gephyra]